MSPLIPFSDVGQVESAMATRGYQASDTTPWLAVPLPMGSMVTMQLGGSVGVGQGGRPQLNLRCVLQINGDLSPPPGWHGGRFARFVRRTSWTAAILL